MKQKIKTISNFIIKNIKWIILFLCIILFLGLLENVFEKEMMKSDIIGYQFISDHFISASITPIAKFITNLGGAIVLISITIIFYGKYGFLWFFNISNL